MTFQTRTILFAVYCLAVALVNLPVLRAVFELSRRDASSSHLVLIPFVCLALVYHDRKSIFRSTQSAQIAGAAVIAVGVALLWAGRIYRPFDLPGGSLSMAMGAVVVLWVGGFLAWYGRAAFWAALFPLLFLAFTIPIPEVALKGAVSLLKRGSSDAVALLFAITGTPFHRDGFVFSLPNFVIEVADECSGIRSSIALVLTSLLAGHMLLRNAWKKALLVLLVFPLTIIKNGIRIVTLSLLAMHVDPGFLTGQLHHEGGIVFFLLALAILFPVFTLLRRSEAEPTPIVTNH